MDTFNVMMIGGTGAGKTSFMGAVYNRFGDREFKGFSISLDDYHQRSRLSEIGREVSEGRYPEHTDISASFNFTLRFKGRDLVQFDWIDYRGGLLFVKKDEYDDEEQMKELMGQIAKSHALLLFLDSAQINTQNKEADEYKEYESYLDRVSDILQRAINKIDGKKDFPVAVIFTKGDKVGDFEEMQKSELYKQYERTIKTQIINNSNIKGLMACTKIGVQWLWFWHVTRNIEYPFLHCLYYIVHQQQEVYEIAMKAKMAEAERLHPTIWNWIKCLFTGEETDWHKKSVIIAEAKRIGQDAAIMDLPLAQIKSFIEDRTSTYSASFRYRV